MKRSITKIDPKRSVITVWPVGGGHEHIVQTIELWRDGDRFAVYLRNDSGRALTIGFSGPWEEVSP